MRILKWLRQLFAKVDHGPACRLFLDNRDAMLELFYQTAIAAGKPRGLRWVSVEAVSEPVFAIEFFDDMLVALWPSIVVFEPFLGSEMEGVPQASGPRGVNATFTFRRGQWRTTGKGLFNETVDEFLDDNPLFERIEFNPHRTA